jgi:hypothetical protein
MEPIAPNTPLAVTLEAQQWNNVMAALVKAPYELAAPLIQAISTQLQQQTEKQPQPGNGADRPTPPMLPVS